MKISDRDKKLILFVLLVAVIALPIFLFIRPQNSKIGELESQLVELNDRYEYLKGLYDKKDDYEKKIVELNAERDTLIEDFPGGILTENTIMFYRNTEIHFDEKFRAQLITFADDEETEITEAKVSPEGEYIEGLTAIKSTTTVNYSGHYEEVRDFINYVFTQKDKMILSMMQMELDPETNLIKGTFVLDQYAISGNGKEVEQTKIPGMEHGVKRPFKLMLDEDGNVKSYWRSLGVIPEDEESDEDLDEDTTEL